MKPVPEQLDLAIIGAGISGLAAGFRYHERCPNDRFAIFEAGTHPGGWIQTEKMNGFTIERGPDSLFLDKLKPPEGSAHNLVQRLGLADRAIRTQADHRGVYMLSRRGLQSLPRSMRLFAPFDFASALATPGVGWRAKIRAACEPWIRKSILEEESLGAFVRRRYGQGWLDYVAQPLAGGIYGADPDELSIHATLPQFPEMEQAYGSVFRGLREGQKEASGEKIKGAVRYANFISFPDGCGELVQALASRLDSHLYLSAAVRSLQIRNGGWQIQTDSKAVLAKKVILAIPAKSAAALLSHSQSLHRKLSQFRNTSSTVVTLVWPQAAVRHPRHAFGFVVPRALSDDGVIACTFTDKKWPGRVPNGQALMRVFLSDRVTCPGDSAYAVTATKRLQKVLGIDVEPSMTHVQRFNNAMPLYAVKHKQRVQELEAEIPKNLRLAGNSYYGVGIADAILAGEHAADEFYNLGAAASVSSSASAS